MHKPSSLKSTITILVIIALAVIGYFYYESTASAPSESLLSAQSGPSADVVGAQVLGLLNQIQSLKIDSALFTDPGYQSLHDFSVQIPPENVGRANPFAPLPGEPTSPSAPASH